ncbi:bifunctional 5,10-methylenetetrahydrofolate dehydrogenase/5,10-methenyltetrahydrofolate cyclohydrolase [Bacillota bacterium LX-D]|nr:bifunctional 5,10-methylenetetrahydrofolate dehydrogenase/5,10-methenyltetrahydrofolate cyclohydrolase [Bacillota bacterium LX-D]
MVEVIDVKSMAAKLKEELTQEVASLKDKGIVPKMVTIIVGDDAASKVYAQSKGKMAMKLGIDCELIELPASATQEEVEKTIIGFNNNTNVHGIMLELPLPAHIRREKIVELISPVKDVDGVNPLNKGYLLSGGAGLFPATPQSCMEILHLMGINLKGKEVVLVGCGETVGKPLSFLLLRENPTLTLCHEFTVDLSSHTKNADIVISAAGCAKLIKGDMLKQGAILIDVGINKCADGICGDVDFESVKEVAGALTPVPGGVGSLTTVLIFRNLLQGLKMQLEL